MPSPIRRQQPERPRVIVPRRVAEALNPSVFRGRIPPRVTLSQDAPPFTGELREEQNDGLSKGVTVRAGQIVVIAELRRAWNFVGFLASAGTAIAPGLNAFIEVEVRGGFGRLASTLLAIPNGAPLIGNVFIVGARARLTVSNATASDANGVHGVIWGMSER